MRIAEKAFIYLIQVKNIPWAGSILQIFLSSSRELRKLFLTKYNTLISFIGEESAHEDRKENNV
jgi:hypothetical protein